MALEQGAERHRQEHEEGPVQQMGDDAHANKRRVRDDVRGGGPGVARHVHLGINEPFRKAAEDADEQVEYAGDPRKLFR
jgi:hypothetical protein